MSWPSTDAPPGLDVAAVTGWLAGHGLVAPMTFERMGDGQSNLTYLVIDAEGRRRVLRRPPLGHLLPSAHDVAREHRVMSALAHTGLVPTPVALCRDPKVCDVPLLLMELVEGTVVDSRAVAEALPPDRRRAIGLSLVDTLGGLHRTDLAATGLTDLASHKPYAGRQLRRWRRQWDDTGLRQLPRVHEVTDRLERCIPPQHETTLVHGDYHLLNVVTDSRTGSLTGVLDWELCTLGDPLADLGGLLAYWPDEDGEPGSPTDIPSLPGFPRRAELVQRYAGATGRDVSSVGFWFAFGCWKLAVVGEGVRSRSLREPRNTPRTARLSAHLVDDMLDRAVRVADAYDLPQ